jgi:hypothetical protein
MVFVHNITGGVLLVWFLVFVRLSWIFLLDYAQFSLVFAQFSLGFLLNCISSMAAL